MVVGPQLLIYGKHRIYGFTFKPILKLLITYFTIWFRYLSLPRPTQRLTSDQWLILELIIAMVCWDPEYDGGCSHYTRHTGH